MLNKTLQNIVDEIIGKAFNALRFNLLGPDRVSKAYVLSLRGSKYDFKTSIPGAYIEANLQHSHDDRSIDRKVIQSLTDVAEGYIDNLQQKSTADINRIIEQYLSDISIQAKLQNQTERDYLLSENGQQIIKSLKEELMRQKEQIDKIAATIVEYERHKAYNFGATDGILSAAKSIGIADPTVYKVLVDDERLCPKCRSLWLVPGSDIPKTYRLSELSSAPGSDHQHPAPSISPTHINCRCVLVTLMPGFGFNKDGKIVYKGKDPDTGELWDEYRNQHR